MMKCLYLTGLYYSCVECNVGSTFKYMRNVSGKQEDNFTDAIMLATVLATWQGLLRFIQTSYVRRYSCIYVLE